MEKHNARIKAGKTALGMAVFSFIFFSSVLMSCAYADITTGLMGRWSFDEGTGTAAADASGNGNTATVSNAAWSSSGKVNGALDFNGSNSYVDVAANTALNDLQSFTYTAWVNMRTLGEGAYKGVIVIKNGVKTLGLTDSIGNQFFGSTLTSSVNAAAVSPANTITFNNWIMLTFTYDNSTKLAAIYLNGLRIVFSAGAGSLQSDAAQVFRIGKLRCPVGLFVGKGLHDLGYKAKDPLALPPSRNRID